MLASLWLVKSLRIDDDAMHAKRSKQNDKKDDSRESHTGGFKPESNRRPLKPECNLLLEMLAVVGRPIARCHPKLLAKVK
jgi:hypothetical protein